MAKLSDLEVYEVSLVPKGANNKKYILMKEFGGNQMGNQVQNVIKGILEANLKDEKKADEILKSYKLSEEAEEVTKSIVKLISAYKDELPQDVLKAIGDITDLKVEKSDSVDEPVDEDISKSLNDPKTPESVRKAIDFLTEQNKATVKKNEELEAQIKKAENEKLDQQFNEIVKGYKNISATDENLAQVLKSVGQKAPQELNSILKVLKAADELLDNQDIYKEFGSNGQMGTNDTWGKIEKMAEVEAKENKMTKEEAISKVLQDNPNLYSEYLKENNQ